MIDTIIFDLDGTLLNTLDDLYYSTNYALKTFCLKERTYEEVRCFVGHGVKNLIDVASNYAKNSDEILACFKAHYQVHAMDHISVYPGIIELLTELKKRNIKTAVVTNKFDGAAKNIISTYLGSFIDITLGETPSLKKKPDPDMCNKVLELLNSKKESTIYIGDSEVDIETAINAKVYGVCCTWGFRDEETLIKAGAKVIIHKPIELLNLLDK